jgi:hypothetical protein
MLLTNTPAEAAFNAAHSSSNCQAAPCGARWALWLAAVVVDPASGHALAFYQLNFAQPGNFNFHSLGSSVAVWQDFACLPQRPVINPPVVAAHPDLLFNPNEPAFGSAALIQAGTLYVYGCGIPAGSGFDKGCRLGRVDPANVLDRSAWTCYTGSGWSPQISQAQSVFSGDSFLSVEWNSFLSEYVAVYSQPFSNNVLLRSAPNPEGPWSRPTQSFVGMAPSSGNIYDALAHPEYDLKGGRTIFVSFTRDTPAPFTSEVRLVAVKLAAAPQQQESGDQPNLQRRTAAKEGGFLQFAGNRRLRLPCQGSPSPGPGGSALPRVTREPGRRAEARCIPPDPRRRETHMVYAATAAAQTPQRCSASRQTLCRSRPSA